MRRFFLEKIREVRGKVFINGQEARHISRVLRMCQGDRLVLMDALGRRFQAVIQNAGTHGVVAEIESELPPPPKSPVRITICQSLLKSGNMDLIIQKTSELGVDRICPFISARTVAALDEKKGSHRMKHWQKIARSSTGQAGRVIPAEIDIFRNFGSLINRLKHEEACKAILWEEESSIGLKGLLTSYERVDSFIGIIGPEGGFEEKEIDAAKKAGFVPISLGQRILRSETASIALAAIVQYECGDLNLITEDPTVSNPNGD